MGGEAVTRKRWFDMEPVEDEAFLETAPMRLSQTWVIDLPAGRVWEDLTGEDPFDYVAAIQGITWTSPRPFGVGTTRQVRLAAGAVVVEERYFLWEEGRRKAFHGVRGSAPGFRRLAEDYLVEPVTASSCRFTWTIAAEAAPGFGLLMPGNRLLFRRMFGEIRKHYRARPVQP